MSFLEEKKQNELTKRNQAYAWAGLLAEGTIDLKPAFQPVRVITALKNIAGLDLPVFTGLEFAPFEYDLFISPLWLDTAIEELKKMIALRQEIKVLEQGIELLKRELRITAQRVNLFEKVKIPEAEEAIRAIKIYLGDQMTNAVGRSKIAKRKIEAAQLQEAGV